GLHPAVLGGFAVLDFPGDPPVAVVDRWPHGVLVEDPEEAAHYTRLHDILQGRALPLGETRALLLSQTRQSSLEATRTTTPSRSCSPPTVPGGRGAPAGPRTRRTPPTGGAAGQCWWDRARGRAAPDCASRNRAR